MDVASSTLTLNNPKNTPTHTPVNTAYTSQDLGFSLLYPTGWAVSDNENLVMFSPSTQEPDPKNLIGAA
jgi:hypothetical protein